MSFELNSAAYSSFAKLEIAIREFLIRLILEGGSIDDWAEQFLGKSHLENVKTIGLRIQEAYNKNAIPEIQDIYIRNLNRAHKTSSETLRNDALFHPFYYLTWSELISLLGKSPNKELVINKINKVSFEIIVNNLTPLNSLRNDIAHSRLISNSDYSFIESAYHQVSSQIPNFQYLINNQSSEERLGILIKIVTTDIEII